MGCCGQTIGRPHTNDFLGTKDNSNIRFSNNSVVVTDGPNTLAKIDLCELNIPYEQFTRTSITLKPNASNVPLQYVGLLGSNITYLLLVATYESSTVHRPTSNDMDMNNWYVDYFFKTEPDIIRHFAQMMVLTGTEYAPISEVLLNNPSPNRSVKIDIIAATTSTDIQDSTTSINEYYEITNALWTDILTDPNSGDFIIYSKGSPVAYIDRTKISNIEVNGRILSFDDIAVGQIDITFIDDFNANQANSIITWAMNDSNNIIRLGMSADLDAPVITYKDTFTTEIILNLEGTNSTNAFNDIITKQDLYAMWIESVIDNRDGELLLDDTNMTIIELETGNNINAITRHGKYDITIQVTDIAQNIFKDAFLINVKDTKAAKQIVKTWITNYIKNGAEQKLIYLQDYSGDMIKKQDLIDLVLDKVIDERDGLIPLNINNINVTILQNNINLEYITEENIYYIQFEVIDNDKNTSTILWENENVILTDQLNNQVDHIILFIQQNESPDVQWRQPEPYEIDLYQFNVNGIISKNQLYTYLVLDVIDDRTNRQNIFLIDSKIIKTHDYNEETQEYVGIDHVELYYVDSKGIYTYEVQHIDSDAEISTDLKTITII